MSCRAAFKWALIVALILLPVVTEAAPRAKRSRGRASPRHEMDAAAKKVDLFKAISAKQVVAMVMPQTPGLAVLRILNDSEEPLTVEVPLMLGAKPQLLPVGGNRNTNLAMFGTPDVPNALAGVISPEWSNVSVEKKRGKRKPPKKTAAKADPEADENGDAPAGEAAEGDAKPAAKTRTRKTAKPAKPSVDSDEEKPADDKKDKADSTVALVPLPVGGEQDLPMVCVGVEWGKSQPRPAAVYTVTELEETTKTSEIKTLLEQLGKGKIPDSGVAQILAWRYTARLSWDDLANSGRVLLPLLETAKQLDDKLTGGKGGEK